MRFAHFIILLALISPVFADGGSWRYNNGWQLNPEENQYASIDFQNDLERLLITIELNDNTPGQKAVWVLPIPAAPTSTHIELTEGFPTYSGASIRNEAKNVISGAALFTVGIGLFPANLPILFFGIILLRGTLSSAQMLSGKADGSSYYSGISIYERVSKGGVTSELVATNDPKEIQNYLAAKGVDLPFDGRQILSEYVGKEYSFVVTYISNWEEFTQRKNNQNQNYGKYANNLNIPISLLVKFPTNKAFFPLKLTKVYGEAVIPIKIKMVGNFKPILYDGLTNVKTDYFVRGSASNYNPRYDYNGKDTLSKEIFRDGKSISGIDYTDISINTESRNFREDLWFEEGLPISFEIRKLIMNNFWFIAIVMLFSICIASSILAGKVSFKDNPIEEVRLGMHGLWGITTMIGMIPATYFWNTKKLDEKTVQKLKEKNISTFDNRKISYTILYYVFMLVLTGIIWLLATLIL